MKIIDLPRLTNRGSYIVHGHEYMFPYQKRLRSGAYVRTGQNDELRTFFNLAKGRNFHLGIHPVKGHFQFQVESTRNLPLYPILRALGVTDAQMVGAWGRETFVQNRVDDPATTTRVLNAVCEKMSYGAQPPADPAAGVRAIFDATAVDADNVALSLGHKWPTVTGDMLLAASAKMLKVGRGEAAEDNRESLIHNDVVDLGDYIVERFKDPLFRGRVKRTIAFNLDRRDKIAQIVSRDAFQHPVDSLYTQSELAEAPTQTNPLGMIGDYTRVTVRGEGGIREDNALTKSLRALDPSHLGFLDPAHTPEGQSVGTVLHLATGARKRGRTLVTRVFDVKTGKEVEKTPVELWNATVAFPESVDPKTGRLRPGARVKATLRGHVAMVDPKSVDYAFVMAEHLLDVNTNSIPFVNNDNGARVMLASKLSSQAKSLVGGEPPMIQVATASGTVEGAIGRAFSPKSPVDGWVTKITSDAIYVDGQRIPIPDYFPLNNHNFVHAQPTVKVGDHVKKDQVIADTNHTRDGLMAMGRNLLTAYVPYKGLNVEDGVVISQAASQKMTSSHLYQKPYAFDTDTVIDLKKFRAYFPHKFTDAQVQKLDDKGVVKKGQIVDKGDVLVAAMRHQVLGTESQRLARVSKILAREYRDDSLTWDKDVQGMVQDVTVRAQEIVVNVLTHEPMRIGDKIVGRHANKGVVVQIIPDSEMPKDSRGRTIDLLLNPNGVVSRMNLGQILETTASKVAEKTGKPYVVRSFSGDAATKIKNELKAHGLDDHEAIFDPVDNKSVPGILVGHQYVYKLEHQATKKMSARGGGAGEVYTSEGQAPSGAAGGRAIGTMELYALLAHGALANVHEMYGRKSSYDPEVWRAIESGAPLPPPRPAHSQLRFEAMLKGMGIQTHVQKNDVALLPFLDRHIKEISNGEITDHKLLRGKDLKEEPNGLFDTRKTGGAQGDKFTHIVLPEPVPNPTFEDAILTLTHLKKADFDAIMGGEKKIGGLSGGRAIQQLLSTIDAGKRLAAAEKEVVGKSGSELNALHREIRFLRVLRDQRLRPEEYVISRVPVLPPKFRPIYTLPDGSLNTSDVNFHYQALLQLGQQMKSMKGREFEEQRKKLTPTLYKAVGGVMGLDEGIVERAKRPKGLAQIIAGVGSPKGGYFQEHLLHRRQDISATNVIIANPHLGIDEIGVPEAMAWKTFRPFVIRELRVMGLTPLAAAKAVDDHTPQARQALDRVVAERHVIVNRAPTLHKFSVMAFKPRLVPGYALEIPPLIVGGLNADFDGNCCAGSSKIMLTLAPRGRRLNSIDDVERVYEMKFAGDTKIVARHGDGSISLDMEIQDVPHLPETRVLDKNGASVYRVPEGLSVWSYDHERHQSLMMPVTGLTIEDNCPVKEVTTSDGHGVIASVNDSLCVYDHETGNLVATSPDQALGMLSPVMTKIPIDGDQRDWDWGWMTGAFVSDGFFTGRWMSAIGYTKLDDAKRARFAAIVDKHQTGKYRQATFRREEQGPQDFGPRSTKDHFYGLDEELKEYFASCYMPHESWKPGDRACLYKKLPDFSTWSDGALWGLVNGLLDGDGSIGVSHSKPRPQIIINFSTSSKHLAEDIVLLFKKLGIRTSITTLPGNEKRNDAHIVNISAVDLAKNIDRLKPMSEKAREVLPLLTAGMRDFRDIVPVPTAVMKKCASELGPLDTPTQRCLATTKSRTKPYFHVTRDVAKKMVAVLGDEFGAWKTLVAAEHVHWDIISEIKDGGRIRVFDLMVPGTKVFVVDGGLVIWDTMGIHVPLSAEANAEAAKMLPSRHLYKPGSGKLQPKIEHEYVLGLYKISVPGPAAKKKYKSTAEVLADIKTDKIVINATITVPKLGTTTPGRVLINESLPVALRDYRMVWTDSEIQKKLIEVDKTVGRQAFVDTLQAWSHIGRKYAYLTGSSFLLSDLQTHAPARDAAYAQADKKVADVRRGPGSETDKRQKIVAIYAAASNDLQKSVAMGANASGRGNNVMDMMRAGARGNPSQIRQMVSNVGVMVDHENQPMPEPVRGTYTEGLSSAEFFQHMYGNRKGMIDKSQSVKDPGALTKQVIVSAAGHRVSMVDCGTSQGLMAPTSGLEALDRYLAEVVGGVGGRATVVTPRVLDAARKRGLKTLKVRSPLTCQAPVGVCARCQGLDEEGHLPSLGDHVGIKEAQGLTEPSTQLAMKSFHLGGVMTGKKTLTTSFDRVEQLFNMPDAPQNKAILAEVGGRVDNIHSLPQGGSVITVAGKDHRVPRTRKPVVKVGDVVDKGQELTDGHVQPQDMLRLRGLRAMQTRLRDDIHQVYAEAGEHIAHKTIETPVRLLTESIRITDPGAHPSLVAGDYAKFTAIEVWNREHAGQAPVRFVHELPGAEFMPHHGDDWAQRMAHNRITQVLTQAPAMGAKSPLTGGAPYAALVYGQRIKESSWDQGDLTNGG